MVGGIAQARSCRAPRTQQANVGDSGKQMTRQRDVGNLPNGI